MKNQVLKLKTDKVKVVLDLNSPLTALSETPLYSADTLLERCRWFAVARRVLVRLDFIWSQF
jgi:hypothetical protein